MPKALADRRATFFALQDKVTRGLADALAIKALHQRQEAIQRFREGATRADLARTYGGEPSDDQSA